MLKKLFRKKSEPSDEQQLAEWEKNGRVNPPPHIVKQKVIHEYAKKYNCHTLVETGTFLGQMITAQQNNFEKIYSIELSERLFDKAVKKFKTYSHIKILQGDSGNVLNVLMPELNDISIFWLDGHYSEGITAKGEKECPVVEELETIFKNNLPHIILIDDARMFNGTHDYPTTNEIKDIIGKNNKNYSLEIKDDIIRLTPNEK